MVSEELETTKLDVRDQKDKDDDEDESCERVEHASDIIGDWGPYQLRIFIILSVLYLVAPFHNKALVYYAPRIGFWCKRPDGYENATQETCSSYENSSIACNEWEYDSTFYKSTIIQEYDLVCERAWLVSMAQSCFQIGYLLASICVGLLSDRFGRLTALKLCVLTEIITGILLIFAPNIFLFGILRVIGGTAAYGRFLSSYLLIMESVGPHLRAKVAICSDFGWSFGDLLRPGIYYLIRDYKQMQLWLTGFEILMFFFIWKMDESLRWLVTHGQFDKARKSIVKAAAEKGELNVSKVESKLVLFKQFLDKDEELRKKEEKESLLDLYRVPTLLKYSVLLYFAWFVMSLIAYALVLNVGDLAGDLFVNSFATAVASTTAVTSLSTTLSIFGVLSLAAAGVVSFLPQTQEKDIPDIISESTKDTQPPQRVGNAA